MNILRQCFKWASLVALVLLLIVPYVSMATAQDTLATEMTLSVPSQVSLGDIVQARASLRDASGVPVDGATVRFFSYAAFLAGSTGFMEIGEATTDGEGVATLEYLPRRNGDIEVVAKYEGTGRYTSSQASATFVTEGNEQLYEANAGFSVPLINKWFLVGVMGVIWSLLLLVGFFILKIALAPPE